MTSCCAWQQMPYFVYWFFSVTLNRLRRLYLLIYFIVVALLCRRKSCTNFSISVCTNASAYGSAIWMKDKLILSAGNVCMGVEASGLRDRHKFIQVNDIEKTNNRTKKNEALFFALHNIVLFLPPLTPHCCYRVAPRHPSWVRLALSQTYLYPLTCPALCKCLKSCNTYRGAFIERSSHHDTQFSFLLSPDFFSCLVSRPHLCASCFTKRLRFCRVFGQWPSTYQASKVRGKENASRKD